MLHNRAVPILRMAVVTVLSARAQETSTPEERAQSVEITHKLEGIPLDDSVNQQGEAFSGEFKDVVINPETKPDWGEKALTSVF